jgi:hypothetical protein
MNAQQMVSNSASATEWWLKVSPSPHCLNYAFPSQRLQSDILLVSKPQALSSSKI